LKTKTSVSNEAGGKKPFDKKKWRENKYSHKAKVGKWNDKRNQSIQNKYFRMLKKSGNGADSNLTPLGTPKAKSKAAAGGGEGQKGEEGPIKKGSFKQSKLEFERRQKKAEKMEKAAVKKRQHEERVEAIKEYKKRKEDKFKNVLSRKTKKGQPVMAVRMDMLLEKIKQSTSSAS